MTTVNYSTPVNVNGYSCKNCTDVDNAKRNIDPAHPKDGPFGVNRAAKPGEAEPAADSPAVILSGALSQTAKGDPAPPTPSATQGHKLDLRA